MTLNIGLITYGLDRPITGISRQTLELAKAFADFHTIPDFILLQTGDLGPLAEINTFHYAPLTSSSLLPDLMTVGQVSLNRAVRRLALDVIHDPTGVTPFSFVNGRFRTVVTVHDVFAWSLPGHSSLLDTLIYKWWLPRILPEVDALITISQQSRKDIIKYLELSPDMVRVIPYGVSILFRPLPEQAVKKYLKEHFEITDPFLLYVGSLTKRKNIERIIEAFSLIQPQFDRHRLVMAGTSTWKKTPVEEIVTRLGLTGSVIFTGPLTDKALPSLYNGADLFVFPSLYEGFGLPVLEAMACGTPVITSNTTSLPEVAGEAAILVDPYSVDQIAGAMRRVLEDKELAQDLRERGLERAKQFTWERTARETIKVYEKVLGQKILDDG